MCCRNDRGVGVEVGCSRTHPAAKKEQSYAVDIRNFRMGKVAE